MGRRTKLLLSMKGNLLQLRYLKYLRKGKLILPTKTSRVLQQIRTSVTTAISRRNGIVKPPNRPWKKGTIIGNNWATISCKVKTEALADYTRNQKH